MFILRFICVFPEKIKMNDKYLKCLQNLQWKLPEKWPILTLISMKSSDEHSRSKQLSKMAQYAKLWHSFFIRSSIQSRFNLMFILDSNVHFSIGMLDKHIRIVHNKERPFKCHLCGASFGQKVHMDSHINAIHIQNRPYKCELCVYCATTKGLLDKHFRTVHQKEKPFECELCQSRFGQKAHLNKHIVTVHRKEKPYKCDYCQYQTSTKATLNKHISVIHNKEKPFSCQLCPNCHFGQKAHLDNHIRQVHNIQNPYKCVECSQAFSTANNLKIHVVTEHEQHLQHSHVLPEVLMSNYQ